MRYRATLNRRCRYTNGLCKYEKVRWVKTHPDVAALLNNLAGLYETQSDNVSALSLYERALRIFEKTPGNPQEAALLNNLAGLYYRQGDYESALPLYEKALKILQEIFDDRHPHIAITLENMAYLYDVMGDGS